MTTKELADELERLHRELNDPGFDIGVAKFNLLHFIRYKAPAIVAALRDEERLRESDAENEQQLVYISNFLKKDARDVRGDGPYAIAALVSQEFSALEAENAKLRKQLGQSSADELEQRYQREGLV